MTDEGLERLRASELRKLQDLLRLRAGPAARPAGVLEATDASLDAVLAQAPLAAVDAYATWCGPCKAFAPHFARAAQDHPRVAFAKVDVDRNPAFAARHRIQSIPTLLLFARGQLVGRLAGALPPAALGQALRQLESLETSP